MMMPANFTAVNSEVVYGGATLFSVLADTTAPIWNATNVKTFNTNLLTILSNTFTADLVSGTLGVMFGGNWGKDGDQLFDEERGGMSGWFYNSETTGTAPNTQTTYTEMTGLNKVMKTIGLAASVYTLGTTPVKNFISENVVGINGKM